MQTPEMPGPKVSLQGFQDCANIGPSRMCDRQQSRRLRRLGGWLSGAPASTRPGRLDPPRCAWLIGFQTQSLSWGWDVTRAAQHLIRADWSTPDACGCLCTCEMTLPRLTLGVGCRRRQPARTAQSTP